ncbi:MAG: hypothetical protein NDJ89_01385 [Oligoflexia bacterium]|nr:hypothetical protein [Oligoflexia bacterium]
METRALEEILDYLCNDLGGDWLLTGGSLVRLEFDAGRGTEDVDLVRMRHSQLSDEAAKNLLFRWLIARGLGPEWVNSAVEPFVREIADWANETVEIRAGKTGKVYRPTFTLFTYLKLRRGTEEDLKDIKAAVPKCPEGFDEERFLSWADAKLRAKYFAVREKLLG